MLCARQRLINKHTGTVKQTVSDISVSSVWVTNLASIPTYLIGIVASFFQVMYPKNHTYQQKLCFLSLYTEKGSVPGTKQAVGQAKEARSVQVNRLSTHMS